MRKTTLRTWLQPSHIKFRHQLCAPQCGVKAPSEQGYSPISGIRCCTGMCLCHCILRRRLLICDCELHFNLQTVGSWTSVYGGFDYNGLYNYVVDFFEDTPGPAAKKRAQELLNWWSM